MSASRRSDLALNVRMPAIFKTAQATRLERTQNTLHFHFRNSEKSSSKDAKAKDFMLNPPGPIVLL